MGYLKSPGGPALTGLLSLCPGIGIVGDILVTQHVSGAGVAAEAVDAREGLRAPSFAWCERAQWPTMVTLPSP